MAVWPAGIPFVFLRLEQRSRFPPVSTFHLTPRLLFPQVPSNKYRLALLLSFTAWCINHFHNYKFWGAPWLNGQQHKHSSLMFLACFLPGPLQDHFGLFSAPLAKAEELVSGAARSGEKLVATGLQLPVSL